MLHEQSRKTLLKPEKVEFLLEWEGNKTTLSDIRSLRRKAFHVKAKHVIVKLINKGNSIIVMFYAPHHLHKELKILVKSNEGDLRKMKVLSVTIGGFEILKRDKVRRLPHPDSKVYFGIQMFVYMCRNMNML